MSTLATFATNTAITHKTTSTAIIIHNISSPSPYGLSVIIIQLRWLNLIISCRWLQHPDSKLCDRHLGLRDHQVTQRREVTLQITLSLLEGFS